MNKDDITVRCSRCNDQHKVIEMVMDASGHGMTCKPCAGLAPNKPERPSRERPKVRQRFKCAECSFAFTSSQPQGQAVCGYCGSKAVLTKEQSSAESLLRL